MLLALEGDAGGADKGDGREQLQGTVALLTGAAGGIGAHIARTLAGEGVGLALSGRNVGALEQVRDAVRGRGVAAEVVPADLGDLDEARTLPARAEEAVGPLDILVNNAGIEITSVFTRLEPEEIETVIRVNLAAPMILTHAVVPRMLERRRGHVVQVSSLAGKLGPPYNGPYAASKAGLVALTQSLAAEYAESPLGFSVVCPGFVSDQGMFARAKERGVRTTALLGESAPEDVARAVVDAIRQDRAEVLVNPTPVRPLLALATLSPRAGAALARRIGVNRIFRRFAEVTGRA